jgi:hypothetical protein
LVPVKVLVMAAVELAATFEDAVLVAAELDETDAMALDETAARLDDDITAVVEGFVDPPPPPQPAKSDAKINKRKPVIFIKISLNIILMM